MKNCFKYPGFLEVSKFGQLFVSVSNCLLFPYSLHFLFEGCTLSESVGSLHTIHQLLPVAFAVGSWLAVRQSMAAMLLCLKYKFFKVTEMFQIPFGSIHDLVSCK